MPRSANQKMKLLYLSDILRRESDEQHPLALKDIIAMLEECGIEAERKALYNDLESLSAYGMDICTVGGSNATKYYLGERDFQLAELQLLVDAVACSKFITEKKSRELIKKIEKLASRYQESALNRTVIVANRVKAINEKIYYNIQTLHDAIEKGVKISFLYFGYNMKKRKTYRSDGMRYEMSPYTLAWEDENYYCVGWYEKYGKVSNFRVDRMEDIQLTDAPAQKRGGFNVTEYSRRVFGMFTGEIVKADLKFDKSLISVIMDKFGQNVSIKKLDENNFHITVDVNVSPTFFGWMFQFGKKAQILGPDSLKQAYKAQINEAVSALKENK